MRRHQKQVEESPAPQSKVFPDPPDYIPTNLVVPAYDDYRMRVVLAEDEHPALDRIMAALEDISARLERMEAQR